MIKDLLESKSSIPRIGSQDMLCACVCVVHSSLIARRKKSSNLVMRILFSCRVSKTAL